MLLTPDSEHTKTFSSVPIVGFRNGKSLKNYLVRAKVPKRKEESGVACSFKCNKKRCQVCPYMKQTDCFSDVSGGKMLSKNVGDLNCDSCNVVYLLQCKTCSKQYVGSATTKFRARFNNYKSSWTKHINGQKVPQGSSFHSHFSADGHNGKSDWEVTLIDQADNEISVRRREDFWIEKLNTSIPNGLNDRNVSWELT